MSARFSDFPYLATVPMTGIIVALGSTGLGLGVPGIIGGAVFGVVWSFGLGSITERLVRRAEWGRRLANGSIFFAIVAMGTMLGGGVMYALLMKAAAAAPVSVMSGLMQPAIPFFIILNTPLELLVVPVAVFANWHNEQRRRLILVAAASFYTMRVWSYLVYVPARMEIASRPLSPEDVAWFQQSMSSDYRFVLDAVVLIAFTAAALTPCSEGPEEGPALGPPLVAAMMRSLAVSTLTTLVTWLVVMRVASAFGGVGRVEALLVLVMVIASVASVRYWGRRFFER